MFQVETRPIFIGKVKRSLVRKSTVKHNFYDYDFAVSLFNFDVRNDVKFSYIYGVY